MQRPCLWLLDEVTEGLDPISAARVLDTIEAVESVPEETRRAIGLSLASTLGEVHAVNLLLACGALVSITAGTLYQKRFLAPCDVRAASLVQLSAAFAVTLQVFTTVTSAPSGASTSSYPRARNWFASAWLSNVLTLHPRVLTYTLGMNLPVF